jgi:UreF
MRTRRQKTDMANSAMTRLKFLQLLHLADSALPVGSAAHSFGLESLVVENGLEAPGLLTFFETYLEETGQLDAVFVYAGFDTSSSEEWRHLNQQLSAMKAARETREASFVWGSAFPDLLPRPWLFPWSTRARSPTCPWCLAIWAVWLAQIETRLWLLISINRSPDLFRRVNGCCRWGNPVPPRFSGGLSQPSSKHWPLPPKHLSTLYACRNHCWIWHRVGTLA